ncbi:MAG: Holliday junction branch migration protein RuvA, partial [Alcanivorax sp.]|nr:Holliday junction branch migration protein RuvA [Alcanivorax sp.]
DGPPDGRADAIAALESLGYRNKEAAAAVGRAAEEAGADPSSEELIRRALRTLAR